MAVYKPPTRWFADEEHRDSVVACRLVCLPRNLEANALDLDYIAKLPIRMGHQPLNGVCAIRELRRDPVNPLTDVRPTLFNAAAESTDQGNFVGVRPARLVGCGVATLQFTLRGVRSRQGSQERLIFRALISGNRLSPCDRLCALTL